jgi:WD40 repeat protein
MVYGIAEQRYITSFTLPEDASQGPVLINSSNGLLAVQPAGRTVLIYDLPFNRLGTFPYQETGGALSPDGRYVATAYANNQYDQYFIALWDARTHQRVLTRPIPDRPQSSLMFDASGRYLVACYTDDIHDVEVQVYLVPSLKPLPPMRFEMNEEHQLPQVNLDERGHLLTSYADKISKWDLATSRQIGQPLSAEAPDSSSGATPFAATPDGNKVIVVSQNRHALDVWNLTTGQSRRVSVKGVAVTGVRATPWPDRVLVLRQPDKNRSVLELWDLRASRPTGKVLLDNLSSNYSHSALQEAVGFNDDQIIHVYRGRIDTWNSSGDEHVTVVDTFTDLYADAVRHDTVLFAGPHIVPIDPNEWRDDLCDLLGRPQEAPDMPNRINDTHLCP